MILVFAHHLSEKKEFGDDDLVITALSNDAPRKLEVNTNEPQHHYNFVYDIEQEDDDDTSLSRLRIGFLKRPGCYNSQLEHRS
ncbi:hypothetical protein Trydic_g11117 [Trypoxylus dichotomus]